MTDLLKTENLVKTYKMGDSEVNALNGIDLKIDKGEFVAITGASGSGKSTLMHVIGLLDKPTSGKVMMDGNDVSTLEGDEQAKLRNQYIGFVFQAFNLLPRTSALENVALPLLYAGVGKTDRHDRAKIALEKVGLGERLNHTSTQLSGGQQQRVAVARALINKPKLILADEPTGNLDSKSGTEIMNLLRELNDQGNTIILVTHELDIAKGTKRRIEMLDGKIVKDVKNGHRRS